MTNIDKPTTTGQRKPSDKAKDAANDIGQSARDLQSAAAESAQQGYEVTRDALNSAGTRAREVAEQQPLLVLAGAVAFGVVLGMAISNNRQH